jgi:cyclopropane fatty-acyl-phospholipid synthase-like methyltransferase
MVEHLGHEYLPEWFKHCDRLLAKDGILVIQVIGILFHLSIPNTFVDFEIGF